MDGDCSSSNLGAPQQIVGAQPLPALNWAASGSAPSGTITTSYQWLKTENLITMWWNISCTVAGAGVTEVWFALPGDMPSPTVFSYLPNSSEIVTCRGIISAAATITADVANYSVLRKNSGGGFEVHTLCGPLNALNAWGSVDYT